MTEILDDFKYDKQKPSKDRHGCLTAWLILMIVVNGLVALGNLFFGNTISENLSSQPSPILLLALGGLGILNVIFTIMLFQWKKVGFYGFCCTAIIAFVINLIIGIGVLQSISGLVGIAILYGILQTKGKNGISAWEGLE